MNTLRELANFIDRLSEATKLGPTRKDFDRINDILIKYPNKYQDYDNKYRAYENMAKSIKDVNKAINRWVAYVIMDREVNDIEKAVNEIRGPFYERASKLGATASEFINALEIGIQLYSEISDGYKKARKAWVGDDDIFTKITSSLIARGYDAYEYYPDSVYGRRNEYSKILKVEKDGITLRVFYYKEVNGITGNYNWVYDGYKGSLKDKEFNYNGNKSTLLNAIEKYFN